MSYSAIIELPDEKFKKGHNCVSRIVGIEENISVSRLENKNTALSMRRGDKQLIFEFGVDVCFELIELLKNSLILGKVNP